MGKEDSERMPRKGKKEKKKGRKEGGEGEFVLFGKWFTICLAFTKGTMTGRAQVAQKKKTTTWSSLVSFFFGHSLAECAVCSFHIL